MKVLSIDFNFLLPDDFDGDFNDALMEVIKYRKGLPNPTKFPAHCDDLSAGTWKGFLNAIKQGFKLCGAMFLGELVDGNWVSKRKTKEK